LILEEPHAERRCGSFLSVEKIPNELHRRVQQEAPGRVALPVLHKRFIAVVWKVCQDYLGPKLKGLDFQWIGIGGFGIPSSPPELI
jgi:hypothetical protein